MADEDRLPRAAEATAALLWSACRPDPDREGADEARASGADLPWASRVAVNQRVSPLLWRVVQHWATEDEAWSAGLREDAARCRAQALIVRPRVGAHLLDPLVAAGLTPMVIKGAALADRYPEPGLRPMDDVDLLVRPHEHREAAEILRRAGWQTTRRQGPEYSLSLAHPAMPGLPVDLHCELAVRAEQVFRFKARDLWESPLPLTLFGAQVTVPEPELELLLLATHAGKPFHNFDRLVWAVDAAVVISDAGSRSAPIEWNRVAELSRRAAAGSALAVLLGQAERLGAGSPAGLREVKAGTARRRALEPARSALWPVERLTPAQRARLTYAVIDDPWLRVRQLVYQIAAGGFVRAPALIWRIVHRIWRLRRMPPAAGRTEWSVEDRDEKVDPVVTKGEP